MEKLNKDIALLSKIKTSEPSPYLLSKIYTRIEQLEEKSISGIKLVPIVVGLILLLMVNFYALNKENISSKNNVSESTISIYESNQIYHD